MAPVTRRHPATIDARNQPAYTLAEAARYLKLPEGTLRYWVQGRAGGLSGRAGGSSPLIHPPERQPPTLSFWNLIEAHVLRSLRMDHGVSLPALRKAIQYAQKSQGIERLLLSRELKTSAGQVFLERYGQLISLSASGQLAMQRLFQDHLKRVEWDDSKFPVRLYPFLANESPESTKPIVIQAELGFGRPIVQKVGVSTGAIADRIDAGEQVRDLADDYGLTESEIVEAVLYERAA